MLKRNVVILWPQPTITTYIVKTAKHPVLLISKRCLPVRLSSSVSEGGDLMTPEGGNAADDDNGSLSL